MMWEPGRKLDVGFLGPLTMYNIDQMRGATFLPWKG